MILLLHSIEGWNDWFLNDNFYFSNFYFNQLVNNLGIGVDAFFLISGFLITYLLLEEKKRFNSISIKDFIIRRSLRIWPLYFLLILITPILISFSNFESPHYLANIFFYGNFDTIINQEWTFPFAHFWSIHVEEHFYLICPLIITFVPLKHLLKVFLVIIFLSISFRIYIYNSIEYSWFQLYLNTLSRVDVIVLGCIGGLYYSRKAFQIKMKRIYSLLILALLILFLCIEPVSLWDSWWKAGFKKYIYLIPIIILMLNYNFNNEFKRIAFFPKLFTYLGSLSYGIYMISNIILVPFLVLFKEFEINSILLFILCNIVFTILAAAMSYKFVEKPFLRIGKKFSKVKSKKV